jgi:hypothetical protein
MGNKGTCKAANCDKEVKGKGYCARHYAQWRKGKLSKARYKSCHAENCRKPISRRGLCTEHFAAEFGKKKAAAAASAAPAA